MEDDDELARYLEEDVKKSLPADEHDQSSNEEPNFFCSETNIEKCVQYLNSFLYQQGLPCLPTALHASEPISAYHIVETLNALYAVVSVQQNTSSLLKDKNDQISRAFVENEHLRQNNVKLDEKLDKALRKVAHEQAKEAAAQAKFKAQETKWEQLKAEQQKQILGLKHKDTNYLHEMRKREGEYNRLKERLRAVADNKKETSAIAISSSAPKATSSSRTTMASMDIMVARYENKIQSLSLENQSLRETIMGMDAELRELVQQVVPKSSEEPATPQLRKAKSKAVEGDGPKPFHQFVQEVEKSHRETLHLLRNCLDTQLLAQQQLQQQQQQQQQEIIEPDDSLSKEVLRLSQLLEENKKVIAEQENLLKLVLAEGPTQPASPGRGSSQEAAYLQSQLEAERALWETKEKNFKQERERVTAASIDLANDRAIFESEKRAFRTQLLHYQNATKAAPGRTRMTPMTCYSPFSLRGAALLREGSGSAPGTPTHPSDISLEIFARTTAQDSTTMTPKPTPSIPHSIILNNTTEQKASSATSSIAISTSTAVGEAVTTTKNTNKEKKEKGGSDKEKGGLTAPTSDDSFLREWEMEIEGEKEHDSPLRLSSRPISGKLVPNNLLGEMGANNLSFDSELALLSPIPKKNPPQAGLTNKPNSRLRIMSEKENMLGNS